MFFPQSSINNLSFFVFRLALMYYVYTCSPDNPQQWKTMRQLVNFSGKPCFAINIQMVNLSKIKVIVFKFGGLNRVNSICIQLPVVLLSTKEYEIYVRKENFSHLEAGELSFKPLSREKLNPSASEELMPADF